MARLQGSLANHPESIKYLLFLFVAQNGLGTTVLAIANPYLLEGPPKASPFQVQIAMVVTLLFGLLWLLLFTRLTRRLSYRAMLFIIIGLNSLAICLIGFVSTAPFDGYSLRYLFFLAVAATLIAPGFTWWYSMYWTAFMVLVPKAQINQYGGVFTFIRTFALIWHSGPIYSACVSSVSSASMGHRLGVLTMLGWDALAIPLLLWVDFDKGRKEAGRDPADASESVGTDEVEVERASNVS